MNRFYYDLHIHSCLSPCADDDNTPNNIAGMAHLCGLDIVALTDHNSCKNCPAFFVASDRYGIIPVPGMELTTSEDIHVICLFESLEAAMDFDSNFQKHRTLIPNRTDIFGNQFILDGEDNITGTEDFYLTVASDISIENIREIAGGFCGVCYPAHIDRPSNGIIAVLGTFPESLDFGSYELNDRNNEAEYAVRYSLGDKRSVVSSDAHILTSIKDKENYFELDAGLRDGPDIRKEVIKLLK